MDISVALLTGQKRAQLCALVNMTPESPVCLSLCNYARKKKIQQVSNTQLCHISASYSMWSLCGMRERRQWWRWRGRAPGCKVRNSAPGTMPSENLALIGPSSYYHQLPTQICWQVLSVQKQNPCQRWTQVQVRRRALWHNPLQSCARKPRTRRKLTGFAPLDGERQQINGRSQLEKHTTMFKSFGSWVVVFFFLFLL